MSHNAGLEGPEYLSVWADRLQANGQEIEATQLRELSKSWSQDRRSLHDLQVEASRAPNVGVAELDLLREHSRAFQALRPLRTRALQLLESCDVDLREVHWVDALCSELQRTRQAAEVVDGDACVRIRVDAIRQALLAAGYKVVWTAPGQAS